MRNRAKKQYITHTSIVKLSLATLLSLLPVGANAQNLQCFEPLIFGEIVTCGSAGTVTLRPDNSSSSTCVSVGAAPQSRARCTVTQSFPFRPIQVNVNAASVLISNGTGPTMSVNAFNIVTNAGGTGTTQTVPFLDVPIGATLNVGATQASGTYNGVFGVTAILQ